MKIYDYIFFRMYNWYARIGDTNVASYPMVLISLVQYFNIVTIISIVHLKYFPKSEDNYSVLVGIIFLALNYFKYLHHERYKKIQMKIIETKRIENLRTVMIILYVLVSFALWYYTGHLVRQLNIS